TGTGTGTGICTCPYGVTVTHHGVGNVLKWAGLLVPRKKRVRVGRQLSDREYCPGEIGQMDVKHWKKVAYQYDVVDCATRIKYKRLYPGVSPAETVDFLEQATRFFAPAFCPSPLTINTLCELNTNIYKPMLMSTLSAIPIDKALLCFGY
ncbi:MAG: hypothetical protein ACREHG_02055, partial [Candidatus Saccharimonadales bacterium]